MAFLNAATSFSVRWILQRDVQWMVTCSGRSIKKRRKEMNITTRYLTNSSTLRYTIFRDAYQFHKMNRFSSSLIKADFGSFTFRRDRLIKPLPNYWNKPRKQVRNEEKGSGRGNIPRKRISYKELTLWSPVKSSPKDECLCWIFWGWQKGRE